MALEYNSYIDIAHRGRLSVQLGTKEIDDSYIHIAKSLKRELRDFHKGMLSKMKMYCKVKMI